jgi:hypothetical protein
MLIDLAKRALPVLIGLYGTRLLVSKIGPMIPGVSALGTLQGPALAIGAVIGVNFLTQKVSALAKHRNELLLGAALSALDSLISAFAPASVKSMIGVGDIMDRGMGDYVQMGEYVGVGATPIDDDIAMSDYIAVGSDGVQEELGLEEELGVEEELGNDLLGGMPGGAGIMKTIPGRQFLQPVPARSFTKQIPAAGGSYDNAGLLYNGVFRGGF